MKTKLLILSMLSILGSDRVFSQNRTTVTANNSDISDNLDLRAVASIFGDSANLDDFERRLNDPKAQISNLDLNGDNQVDYLRVIESVEGNTHLVIIQSVLSRDTFQDIATVEIEKDSYNRMQVQVVGDVYMYGNNYIYEPAYAYTPVIYNSFWVNNYRPYYSSWYWNYYPNYYYVWSPYSIFTYQNHIDVCINNHHQYNYVNYRRASVAYNNYYSRRTGNAYENQHPNRSFAYRNSGYANRYELENNSRNAANTRNQLANSGTRNNTVNTTMGSPRPVRLNGIKDVVKESTSRSETTLLGTRSSESPRVVTIQNNGTRNESNQLSPRSYLNTRSVESSTNVIFQENNNTRINETPRAETPRSMNQPNENTRNSDSPRSSSPRQFSAQRENSNQSGGNSSGNRRS